MIRLTKQADYGLMLMTQFADAGLGPVFTAPELAEKARLPLPMVTKTLKLLARGGLLLSHRGAHGGYSLGLDPSEITVSEIVQALEGPISITECSDVSQPGLCNLESHCPMKTHWQVINRAVQSALEGITLEGMTQPFLPAVRRGAGHSPGSAATPSRDARLPDARMRGEPGLEATAMRSAVGKSQAPTTCAASTRLDESTLSELESFVQPVTP